MVNLSVVEKSDVFSRIHSFNSYYKMGEQVELLVDAMEVVAGKKIPLNNATVQVDVQVPSAQAVDLVFAPDSPLNIYQEVTKELKRGLKLKDDGKSGDYSSADGIFGGRFSETREAGIYIVRATISGTKSDGTKVSRQAVSSFQVGSVLKNPINTSQLLGVYKKSWDNITEKEIVDDDFYSTPTSDINDLMGDDEGIEDLMNADDAGVFEGISGFD